MLLMDTNSISPVNIDINTFVNPLEHCDEFWHSTGDSLLKTLWEKEKLLVTSIFSFSHNVFNPMAHNFYVLNDLTRHL